MNLNSIIAANNYRSLLQPPEGIMPIYEYQCEACGEHLEKLQKMSDAAITSCPYCEKEKLKKKISATGFRLKGTGWYETDFKNKKPQDKKPKDSVNKKKIKPI